MMGWVKKHYEICLIFLAGMFLRFIGLNQINEPIFDEIFYPQYGFMYLQGEEFFYAHPPFANYLYSLAIWLYSLTPLFEAESLDKINFYELSVLSYRWLNALIGSLFIPVIYGICNLLSKNRSFAILGALFVAIEGSLIVDSRTALANMFLLFFGFSSIYFLLRFLKKAGQSLNLYVAAILMGITVSIKWSGLGFLFISIVCFVQAQKFSLKNLELKSLCTYLFLATLLYVILFIPDLYLNTQYDFVEKHQQILGYHRTMVSENEHPYCSEWYSWPILVKPIAYYFSQNYFSSGTWFTSVHLLPNPLLNWLSLLAIITMIIRYSSSIAKYRPARKNFQKMALILSVGFLINLVPWSIIDRCLFLYHYQPSYVFSMLALAFLVSEQWERNGIMRKITPSSIIALIIVSFLYWLPIQLGFEIPENEFYRRMWFGSWI